MSPPPQANDENNNDENEGEDENKGDDDEMLTEQEWTVKKVLRRSDAEYKILWDTNEVTWEPREPDICKTEAFAVWANKYGEDSDREAIASASESENENENKSESDGDGGSDTSEYKDNAKIGGVDMRITRSRSKR